MPTRAPSRAVQQRAARLAAEQAAEARRRRRRITLFGVLGALLLSGVIGVVIGTQSSSSSAGGRPPGVTGAGGIVVGSASAPVKVVMYEDPQCPVCARFESTSGPLLAKAVADGKVSVEYRLRSFIGPDSVRAVNALGAAQADGRFEALREALYRAQPKENTGGYDVDTLINAGRAVGLTSSSYADAVQTGRYNAWVQATDDRASRDGNVATPELRINGRPLPQRQLFDSAALSTALGL